MAGDISGVKGAEQVQTLNFCTHEGSLHNPAKADLSHVSQCKSSSSNLENLHVVDVGTIFGTTGLDNHAIAALQAILANVSKYLALHDEAGHINHSCLRKFINDAIR